MNKLRKYVLIYPESHAHLGLFRDLENRSNIDLIVAKKKEINNRLLQTIRKIHTSWTINRRIKLPLQRIWYEPITINTNKDIQYCIIFVDVAINYIDTNMLRLLCGKENVRCVLICINSIDASSVGMLQIREKIFQIPWNDVYSFDPGDRENYGFKDINNSYYSYHKLPAQEVVNDVFFAGGMKGNREDLIFHIYEYLRGRGIKCQYYISALREQMLHNPPYKDEIHYYTGGWKPYEEILQQDMKANVILEIMQENQAGPSLRYYESVCYNKKLITTNKRAFELPYYNPKYMKIIEKPEDIDVEWVKNREPVDYGYKGDFSPIHLLDVVMK